MILLKFNLILYYTVHFRLTVVDIGASSVSLNNKQVAPLPHGKKAQPLPAIIYQPCFCLCFGFSQITITFPFLLITLHFSQIGFTDALTFILKTSLVLNFQTDKEYFQVYLSLQVILPLVRS